MEKKEVKMEKEVLIEIKHLRKKFGRKNILNDLNLTIYRNDLLGVIGKSGQGKSVFMKTAGSKKPL